MPKLTDVKGLQVGVMQDMEALTGCTVVLTGEQGVVCGVDVRGAAPGTRETDLLDPGNLVSTVHAVMLSGGSAYGLAAASGVMRYLEERGVGHAVQGGVVPIVPAAVLYDLAAGSFSRRPDPEMGYEACARAGIEVPEGNFGAGAGATVGKLCGMGTCTKSGQGSWSVAMPDGLTVGALVAVNALGDVMAQNGDIIAGVRDIGGRIIGTEAAYQAMTGMSSQLNPAGNTTIAVVASNARFNKAQARRVAQMAHDGLARSISPIHTMHDGDTIFALATGEIEADVSLVGHLSAQVLAKAVRRAVQNAVTVQGLRCCKE
ncbi:MAG: P1 family peptidase [Syntrophomonadaceae bacterium]|nr:P1 family peptidase [Syntrophomonadaceae bacterium]